MLHILFFRFFIQFSRSRAHRAPATSRFGLCFPHISSRAFRFSRCRGCLYTIQVLAVTSAATTISPFDDIHSRCGGGTLPLVGSNGLEPSTSRLSGVRSNHLSYEPMSVAGSFPIGQTYWWRRTESNCRPPACKAGALPAELRPRIRFVPG